jgi:hypothetical protein
MTEADIAGLCTPFEWKGQTFQVAPRTLAIELMFSNWVQAETARVIRRHREALGPEGYEQSLALWQRDCVGGTFEFGKSATHQALFSVAGSKEMMFLKVALGQAKANGAPADRQLVEQWAQEPETWKQLIEIMIQQDFPNSQGPAPEQP